jgi:hypothetical protein
MDNTEKTKAFNFPAIMASIQTIALLASIASVFILVGRKDAALEMHGDKIKELGGITADLAKAVNGLYGTDREYGAKLDNIQARLDRLERKN